VLAGIDHRDEERTASFFNAQGVVESRDYSSTGVFAQHEWRLSQQWELVYGLRLDDLSTGDQGTGGNLGLQYALHPLARLRASYARGFRAPDLPENFINRITPQGRLVGADVVDPSLGKTAFDLKPETSDQYEIGLGGQTRQWSYDVAAFHSLIEDRISQVGISSGGAAYRTFRNLNEVRIQGLEARAGLQVSPRWRLNAALTLQEAENRETGERLEFTPEHLLTLSADWRATSALRMNLSLQHVGDQFFVDTRSGAAVPSTASEYTRVNLRASYIPGQWENVELFAGVENLFDAEVDSILGSDVGPYLYVGARSFF